MQAFIPKRAVIVNFERPGSTQLATNNTTEVTTPKKSPVELKHDVMTELKLKLSAPNFADTTAENVRLFKGS